MGNQEQPTDNTLHGVGPFDRVPYGHKMGTPLNLSSGTDPDALQPKHRVVDEDAGQGYPAEQLRAPRIEEGGLDKMATEQNAGLRIEQDRLAFASQVLAFQLALADDNPYHNRIVVDLRKRALDAFVEGKGKDAYVADVTDEYGSRFAESDAATIEDAWTAVESGDVTWSNVDDHGMALASQERLGTGSDVWDVDDEADTYNETFKYVQGFDALVDKIQDQYNGINLTRRLAKAVASAVMELRRGLEAEPVESVREAAEPGVALTKLYLYWSPSTSMPGVTNITLTVDTADGEGHDLGELGGMRTRAFKLLMEDYDYDTILEKAVTGDPKDAARALVAKYMTGTDLSNFDALWDDALGEGIDSE